MTRCTFDPSGLIGVPLGQFHCPGGDGQDCGCMVIAGMAHGACEESCEQFDEDDRAVWDRAWEQMAREQMARSSGEDEP